MLWDLFCRVIDNWGDAGVAWRLAAELTARGESVRLWIDDPAPLAWMTADANAMSGGHVHVLRWPDAGPPPEPVGDVLVELFGCEPASEFIAARADPHRSGADHGIWINLEYLSAERWCRRSHGLPSPQAHGPGAGQVRYFYYPGFTDDSGGLLRERDLIDRRTAFDRAAWLRDVGIDWRGQRLVSLFCYEPPGLPLLLRRLAADDRPTLLLVAAGRGCTAFRQAAAALGGLAGDWNARGRLQAHELPLLSQREFDHLLWSCDLNAVRGEDSLVRALWAGPALLWQPYPQHDGAHAAKLAAFLDWLQAPEDMVAWHRHWSGLNAGTSSVPTAMTSHGMPAADGPAMPDIAAWTGCVTAARARLLTQDDLVTRLQRFVAARR